MIDNSYNNNLIIEARHALVDEGRFLTLQELHALAKLPEQATVSLAALAHEVRMAWCGPEVDVEGIVSAKTGACPEDCKFCSQSSSYDSPLHATPFLDPDEVLKAAQETEATGATEFCIVLALRGPDERTFEKIIELVETVKQHTKLNVNVSAGILTDNQARRLSEASVHRYNHNLETSRSFFQNIVTTHTFDERVQTAKLVRKWGMELCCGGIIGLGETDEQRVELIAELAELKPTEVPLNFLNPRPGTPLGESQLISPMEAIKWIALFRLGLPGVLLRYAGGREVTLRELQAMGMTSGINALIVGNYLTTLGRTAKEDLEMLKDLSMPIKTLSGVI
ncbi:MAG: biotin synthase BioB [Actinobacteria bacterium]|nr:biotin synthase BioB [Actinomycetota bacterium]MCL6104349.1 biotin synthase BioB [Actinomycetota bacterium]